jgi:hypothetical protein
MSYFFFYFLLKTAGLGTWLLDWSLFKSSLLFPFWNKQQTDPPKKERDALHVVGMYFEMKWGKEPK